MPILFSFTVAPAGSSSSSPAVLAPGAEAGASAGRDFRLDAEGDLSLENGDFAMIAGAEAIASDLKARLLTFLGECFLDTSLGVPYFTEVFGKNQVTRVEGIFRTEILKTPGVSELLSLIVQKSEDRTLRVTFRVSTEYEEIIEGTLEA